MQATPFSEKQYYPMLLSNGSNAVLVDYAGSLFPSYNGHSHFEQHQSTPCGWYKVSHSWKTPPLKVIQSVVSCGYQVIMNGEICEPKHYCQEFDSRRAILTTKITSFGGVEMKIESFLNDSNILVEHYTFVAVPCEHKVDFALLLFTPDSMTPALGFRAEPVFAIDDSAELDLLGFSYKIGGIEGRGAMCSDMPAGLRKNDDGWPFTSLIFKNIKNGWEITRFLATSDSSETQDFAGDVKRKISACGKDGFGKVRVKHIAVWEKYFGASDISLPDKEFEDIYNLSRYMMRASLHPETGGLTVGMLPHLWRGGTYVPYDAWYLHQAMLLTNNIEPAARHLDYYARQYPQALKTAKEIGASGAAFSGWTNCFGEHKGMDIKDYLLHLKPCMAGFIAMMFYWQWKYSGTLSDEKKNILKDVLEFVERFIVDKGEWAEIAPCMAGNESAVDVSNDSFTSLTFAKVFRGASEMFPESGDMLTLHFRNYFAPDSPSNHKRELIAGLLALVNKAESERPAVKMAQCASWLNNIPFFLELFPEEWLKNARRCPYEPSTGWWGQFIDRKGEINRKNVNYLKENQDFQYGNVHCICGIGTLKRHLEEFSSREHPALWRGGI